MADASTQQRIVYYQGRVQGVGFRYTTTRIASHFRVGGYVRNLPDGRVLIIAEGALKELNGFFAAVRDDLGHFIEEESVTEGLATSEFRDFSIRH